MATTEVIRSKRDGDRLSDEQIRGFVTGIADMSVGDEQLGAFAMAAFLKGLDEGECVALTEAMRDSGRVMRWNDPALPGPVLDKHSTGGVGDVTSLLVAPIVAACGGFVPMITGRGLGHTGGTLDKLAAIDGYDVAPSPERFQQVVREVGCAVIGQTVELAPADRRLYAVRDVTATVDSIELIVASILSKKLAEGLDGLVLDVKTGSGAVMPQPARARELAQRLIEVGNRAGVHTRAVLSDMSQPLADSAGNAVEIGEVIDCLNGRPRSEALMALSRELAAEMLLAGRLTENRGSALAMVERALASGRAAERFAAMVALLGGPTDLLEQPRKHLPQAPVRLEVLPTGHGFVERMDVRALGMAVVELGGGRRRAADRIDPAVGLSGLVRIGDEVDPKHPLAIVHAQTDAAARRAAETVRCACRIAELPPEIPDLISKRLTPGGG